MKPRLASTACYIEVRTNRSGVAGRNRVLAGTIPNVDVRRPAPGSRLVLSTQRTGAGPADTGT